MKHKRLVENFAGRMRVFASVVMIATAASSVASAQAPAESTAMPDAPTAAEARALFERGVAQAEAQDYKSARASFEASHRSAPSRAALFAWAQAERLSGRCERARPLYRAFLAVAPTPEETEAAQLALRRCELQKEAAPAAAPAPGRPEGRRADSPPVAASTNTSATVLAWSGAALAAAGATLITVSVLEDQAAGRADSYQEYRPILERARIERVAGLVTAGVGVASLAVAAYLRWGRADGGEQERRASWFESLALADSAGAGWTLTLQGRWP